MLLAALSRSSLPGAFGSFSHQQFTVAPGWLLTIATDGLLSRIEVSDDEIAEAIRIIYSTTHNCAEGAGAAALAALIKEREQLRGGSAAVILSGQNIDRAWMQTVLAGSTPQVC